MVSGSLPPAVYTLTQRKSQEGLDISLGDLFEGIVLHAFEGKSAFDAETLQRIETLKKIYNMNYDARSSQLLTDVAEDADSRRVMFHDPAGNLSWFNSPRSTSQIGPGRGIGLLFLAMEALKVATSLGGYLYSPMRLVEDELPDALADSPI